MFDANDNLYYNMERAIFLFRSPLMKLAKDYSITIEQGYLLLFLDPFDGISQQELCNKTDKDKGNVSRMLFRLLAQGLIKKEEADNKKKLIYLTEKGQKIKDKFTPALDENTSKKELLEHLRKIRFILGDTELM